MTKSVSNEIKLPLEELKGITQRIRNANDAAVGDSWSDAAVTFSYTIGPDGGTLEGWITYYSGKKIYFCLTGIKSKTGTAAGAGAPFWVRVRDMDEIPDNGTFDISGFGILGATLVLYANGRPIFNPPGIAGTSAAWWDFRMDGTVKYEKHK